MLFEIEKIVLFNNTERKILVKSTYMIPTDPAVKPTARKKTNSSKSLGKEFTIKLM